jgi:hypothetical protein
VGEILDHLRHPTEERVRALAGSYNIADADSAAGSGDSIVDCYAHVLALDVDRLRLERELARLAEIGDPASMAEIQSLVVLLGLVTATADRLRDALRTARQRRERPRGKRITPRRANPTGDFGNTG